jgi:sulfur relay (sulfurtransferase) DsrF/TusC family protein
MKKLLIVIQSVSQLERLQEHIELAFSQAAFGHIVSILFLESAVDAIFEKRLSDAAINPIKQLAAWDIYEIESILAIAPDDAFLSIRQSAQFEYINWCNPNELRLLITNHDRVLTFS